MDTVNLLHYQINTHLPKIDGGSKIIINTINPHSYCVAKKDKNFYKALQESDWLLPDGIGIVWGVRFLTGHKIKRITGYDLHSYLLNIVHKKKGKVFYMGSSNSTLDKIVKRLHIEYPDISVNYYSPPFIQEFDVEDNEKIIRAINNFKPDVLFVGITAPKQEKWVFQHKHKINSKIIASIGAVFDFYAGTVKRAPNWMINVGLEWLYRLIKEPQRMWRRYIIGNFKFVLSIFKAKIFLIINTTEI